MSFTLDKFPSVCRKKPNAAAQPRLGAGVQRTLEGVGCSQLFGHVSGLTRLALFALP
jgi:hypothetical protein